MKPFISLLICTVFFALMSAGCSTAVKEMQMKSQSERTDVFVEVEDGEPIPEGFADLIITANIKTPPAGYYLLESGESLHGKPGYPFRINIDGQPALWKIDGAIDNKPAYDKDGKTSRNPEAREGMKYVLEKKLRLRSGSHRIFFGLPEENYYSTVDITLKDDEITIIEYKPVYRYKTLPIRIPTFLTGIKRYKVFVNNVQIL
jgi:hypothetical protein